MRSFLSSRAVALSAVGASTIVLAACGSMGMSDVPRFSQASLPYQLVKANPASGTGAMTGVTYIQRVALTGGVAPVAMPCAPANKGEKTTVKYQADYIFWKAA